MIKNKPLSNKERKAILKGFIEEKTITAKIERIMEHKPFGGKEE